VDTIVTDLAVVDVQPEGLLLREVARGWTAGSAGTDRRTIDRPAANSGDEFCLIL